MKGNSIALKPVIKTKTKTVQKQIRKEKKRPSLPWERILESRRNSKIQPLLRQKWWWGIAQTPVRLGRPMSDDKAIDVLLELDIRLV